MDLQKFLNNIDDQLKDKTVGHGIAIYEGTVLKLSTSGGHAVLGLGDGSVLGITGNSFLNPSTKMTSKTRMGVMSMSKTITAAAVVALFPWKGLTADSLIAPFLPKSWSRGPKINQLTFRMLLTHTVGLSAVSSGPDPDSTAYANLKKMIANGISVALPTSVQYLNENYALMRVILPYVWHGAAQMDYLEGKDPTSFAQFIADEYVRLCKSWVVAAPSLSEVNVVPSGPHPYTRLYNFQTTSQNRASGMATDVLHTGHDHWYMSAREYGRMIADLRLGTYVAGTACWNTMTQTRAPNAGALASYPGGDARLGIWRFQGKHGEYFGHNGGYQFGGTVKDVVGSFAGWMAFPGNITAAFVANSNLWFGYEQEKLLMDAYDNAF